MPKVKIDATPFDYERFIGLVEQHQVLWNTKLPRYFTDTTKKREAWLEIAYELYPDENFDIKLETEKDEIANMLWSRWKAVRDNYTRENKKIKTNPDTYVTTFAFYNHLLFLGDRPTRVKRQMRSSLADKAEKPTKRPKMSVKLEKEMKLDEEEEEEVEYEEVIAETEEVFENEVYLENDDLVINVENEPEPEQHEKPTYTTTNESIRESTLLSTLVESINKLQNEHRSEPDEHELFLKSLLPDLRKVPSSKKLKVRMDIMATIHKALQD